MKKFLVLCVSAAMLLSTAAASLAATTVNGDFRYDMYKDETVAKGADQTYSDTDLYVRVSGDLSTSVYATANFEFYRASNLLKGNYQNDGANYENVFTKLDEFYVTAKQSWGTAKMGYYEYKFTPSRVELKSAGKHVFPKTDATFEVNVPVAEGFTIDGVFAPYMAFDNKVDDGAYAVAVNYKAENWGAKATYANFANDAWGNVKALDGYYMLNENMKVFADAVDYSIYDGTKGQAYKDGFDPVLGFAWSNIAGITNLYGSAEYAINKRNPDMSNEYTEYVLKASYKLTNGIGLELYHYIKGDDQTQDKFRIRYQF